MPIYFYYFFVVS